MRKFCVTFVRIYHTKNINMKKIGLLLLLAASISIQAREPLAKAFSVADGRQVHIAQSNLHYTQSTKTWAFAEHPYDIIGLANVRDVSLGDEIDLFGWSGSNASTPWGVNISINNYDYGGSFADWGQNTIGTDAPNTWRTLTEAEWTYLLTGRAANLSGVACIQLTNGGYVNGLVLLPDGWVCPEGLTFRSGVADSSTLKAYADFQTLSIAKWDSLAAAGAVFLPASGYRDGFSLDEVGLTGLYWTATQATNSEQAVSKGFGANRLTAGGTMNRSRGLLLRPVLDVVYHTITVAAGKHGTITASKQEGAYNEEITLTATPDADFGLRTVRVRQGDKEIPVTAVAGQENEFTFVMPSGDVVASAEFYGPLPHFTPEEFSVSATKKVYFSPTNLFCMGVKSGNYTFEFALNQTDMRGMANISGGALTDTIDLFGWSGDTGAAKWGVSTSTNIADYAGDFADWGENTIGTDAPNTWRTLTQAEWMYLLALRAEADEKLGVARINLYEDSDYVNGLVLLPDDWTCPDEVAFVPGWGTGTTAAAYAEHQTIEWSEWQQLEASGAVFLPATGTRATSNMVDVNRIGYYWSATSDEVGTGAYYMNFYPDEAEISLFFLRRQGQAVRLVRDKDGTPTDGTPTKGDGCKAKKRIVAGRLVIEVAGKWYDAQGKVLK